MSAVSINQVLQRFQCEYGQTVRKNPTKQQTVEKTPFLSGKLVTSLFAYAPKWRPSAAACGNEAVFELSPLDQ